MLGCLGRIINERIESCNASPKYMDMIYILYENLANTMR